MMIWMIIWNRWFQRKDKGDYGYEIMSKEEKY
jgi:hypothetical protein